MNLLRIALFLLPGAAWAEPGLSAFSVTTSADGSQTYTLSIQILALMTALTLLPAALMMMTSFTRIIIVLAILRLALGTGQTPNNQILIGLALFLTLFVMAPVFERSYQDAVQPYMSGQLQAESALQKAVAPFKEFMLRQTREGDLALFTRLSGRDGVESEQDVPLTLLMPAFITSELKTAFQIGFLLFIPFLVIDLVVASVLMAMGMMMLPPPSISLPMKIIFFVLVDGWALVAGSLVRSF
ncbi:MAG: flagellar type III secretion system pore protein FliP, partial [Gammaproteobacteria bacterium]